MAGPPSWGPHTKKHQRRGAAHAATWYLGQYPESKAATGICPLTAAAVCPSALGNAEQGRGCPRRLLFSRHWLSFSRGPTEGVLVEQPLSLVLAVSFLGAESGCSGIAPQSPPSAGDPLGSQVEARPGLLTPCYCWHWGISVFDAMGAQHSTTSLSGSNRPWSQLSPV
ncbi:hypothetical protein NDU88_003962 [Pleurodeles waltl]|uniref:Uncharacterized protein n=1 Tax=Pleurodeles waltl TaxID=8319 RepID=A0AAV7VEW7_PLEWA|nr:hypothetical protein NDU88_003962 [Pleurodeles waltl]